MVEKEPDIVKWGSNVLSILFAIAFIISLLLVPFFVLRFFYRLARISKALSLIFYAIFAVIEIVLTYYDNIPVYTSNEAFDLILIIFTIIVLVGTVLLPIGLSKSILNSSENVQKEVIDGFFVDFVYFIMAFLPLVIVLFLWMLISLSGMTILVVPTYAMFILSFIMLELGTWTELSHTFSQKS
ncbi:MAG: hypothetical protein QXL94_00755 [Candidatus Parvarchaeum sp.]